MNKWWGVRSPVKQHSSRSSCGGIISVSIELCAACLTMRRSGRRHAGCVRSRVPISEAVRGPLDIRNPADSNRAMHEAFARSERLKRQTSLDAGEVLRI